MAARRIHRCTAALGPLCIAGLMIACSPPDPAPAVPSMPTVPGSPVVPSPPAPPGSPPAPAPPEVTLDRDSLALLAQARRSGQPVVILLVATEPDRTAEALAGLEELGGIVGTGPPAAGHPVGHLRVSMPTENVERAGALPAVTAVDVDQLIPRNQPRPQGMPP
ncbi:MAG: hypothetical protein M3291_14355 [Actinomycetota bacterium]|nr:hypothetical protein [Actinomycetota bacterium]